MTLTVDAFTTGSHGSRRLNRRSAPLVVTWAIACGPGGTTTQAPAPDTPPPTAPATTDPLGPFRVTIVDLEPSPEQLAQLARAIDDTTPPWPLGFVTDGSDRTISIGGNGSASARVRAFIPTAWTTTPTGFRGPLGGTIAGEVTFEVAPVGTCNTAVCLRAQVEHLAQIAAGRTTAIKSWGMPGGRFATFNVNRVAGPPGGEPEEVLVVLAALPHPTSGGVVIAHASAPTRSCEAVGAALGPILQSFEVLP